MTTPSPDQSEGSTGPTAQGGTGQEGQGRTPDQGTPQGGSDRPVVHGRQRDRDPNAPAGEGDTSDTGSASDNDRTDEGAAEQSGKPTPEQIREAFSNPDRFIEMMRLGDLFNQLPEEGKEAVRNDLKDIGSLNNPEEISDEEAARILGRLPIPFHEIAPFLKEIGYSDEKLTGIENKIRENPQPQEPVDAVASEMKELSDSAKETVEQVQRGEKDAQQALDGMKSPEDVLNDILKQSHGGEEVSGEKLKNFLFWFFFWSYVIFIGLLRMYCGGASGKQNR